MSETNTSPNLGVNDKKKSFKDPLVIENIPDYIKLKRWHEVEEAYWQKEKNDTDFKLDFQKFANFYGNFENRAGRFNSLQEEGVISPETTFEEFERNIGIYDIPIKKFTNLDVYNHIFSNSNTPAGQLFGGAKMLMDITGLFGKEDYFYKPPDTKNALKVYKEQKDKYEKGLKAHVKQYQKSVDTGEIIQENILVGAKRNLNFIAGIDLLKEDEKPYYSYEEISEAREKGLITVEEHNKYLQNYGKDKTIADWTSGVTFSLMLTAELVADAFLTKGKGAVSKLPKFGEILKFIGSKEGAKSFFKMIGSAGAQTVRISTPGIIVNSARETEKELEAHANESFTTLDVAGIYTKHTAKNVIKNFAEGASEGLLGELAIAKGFVKNTGRYLLGVGFETTTEHINQAVSDLVDGTNTNMFTGVLSPLAKGEKPSQEAVDTFVNILGTSAILSGIFGATNAGMQKISNNLQDKEAFNQMVSWIESNKSVVFNKMNKNMKQNIDEITSNALVNGGIVFDSTREIGKNGKIGSLIDKVEDKEFKTTLKEVDKRSQEIIEKANSFISNYEKTSGTTLNQVTKELIIGQHFINEINNTTNTFKNTGVLNEAESLRNSVKFNVLNTDIKQLNDTIEKQQNKLKNLLGVDSKSTKEIEDKLGYTLFGLQEKIFNSTISEWKAFNKEMKDRDVTVVTTKAMNDLYADIALNGTIGNVNRLATKDVTYKEVKKPFKELLKINPKIQEVELLEVKDRDVVTGVTNADKLFTFVYRNTQNPILKKKAETILVNRGFITSTTKQTTDTKKTEIKVTPKKESPIQNESQKPENKPETPKETVKETVKETPKDLATEFDEATKNQQKVDEQIFESVSPIEEGSIFAMQEEADKIIAEQESQEQTPSEKTDNNIKVEEIKIEKPEVTDSDIKTEETTETKIEEEIPTEQIPIKNEEIIPETDTLKPIPDMSGNKPETPKVEEVAPKVEEKASETSLETPGEEKTATPNIEVKVEEKTTPEASNKAKPTRAALNALQKIEKKYTLGEELDEVELGTVNLPPEVEMDFERPDELFGSKEFDENLAILEEKFKKLRPDIEVKMLSPEQINNLDDLNDINVLLQLSKRVKEEFKNKYLKIHPDVNQSEFDKLFDEINAFTTKVNETKESEKFALYLLNWYLKGTVRVAEDMDVVEKAYELYKKYKYGIDSFVSPAEVVHAYSEKQREQQEKLLKPQDFPELHLISEDKENEIQTYQVDNNEAGHVAAKALWDSHFPESRTVLCLFSEKTNEPHVLDDKAKERWSKTYGGEKRMVFHKGKVVAVGDNTSGSYHYNNVNNLPTKHVPLEKEGIDKASGATVKIEREYSIEDKTVGKITRVYRGKKLIPGKYREYYFDEKTGASEGIKLLYPYNEKKALHGKAIYYDKQGNVQAVVEYDNGKAIDISLPGIKNLGKLSFFERPGKGFTVPFNAGTLKADIDNIKIPSIRDINGTIIDEGNLTNIKLYSSVKDSHHIDFATDANGDIVRFHIVDIVPEGTTTTYQMFFDSDSKVTAYEETYNRNDKRGEDIDKFRMEFNTPMKLPAHLGLYPTSYSSPIMQLLIGNFNHKGIKGLNIATALLTNTSFRQLAHGSFINTMDTGGHGGKYSIYPRGGSLQDHFHVLTLLNSNQIDVGKFSIDRGVVSKDYTYYDFLNQLFSFDKISIDRRTDEFINVINRHHTYNRKVNSSNIETFTYNFSESVKNTETGKVTESILPEEKVISYKLGQVGPANRTGRVLVGQHTVPIEVVSGLKRYVSPQLNGEYDVNGNPIGIHSIVDEFLGAEVYHIEAAFNYQGGGQLAGVDIHLPKSILTGTTEQHFPEKIFGKVKERVDLNDGDIRTYHYTFEKPVQVNYKLLGNILGSFEERFSSPAQEETAWKTPYDTDPPPGWDRTDDFDGPEFQKSSKDRVLGAAYINAKKILINAVEARLDTLPHEYAHFYIRDYLDSPIVQEGIKRFGSEEKLVQAIGEQATKQKGEAFNWWNKFVKWLLDLMSNRQLLQVLTDSFLNNVNLYTQFGYGYSKMQENLAKTKEKEKSATELAKLLEEMRIPSDVETKVAYLKNNKGKVIQAKVTTFEGNDNYEYLDDEGNLIQKNTEQLETSELYIMSTREVTDYIENERKNMLETLTKKTRGINLKTKNLYKEGETVTLDNLLPIFRLKVKNSFVKFLYNYLEKKAKNINVKFATEKEIIDLAGKKVDATVVGNTIYINWGKSTWNNGYFSSVLLHESLHILTSNALENKEFLTQVNDIRVKFIKYLKSQKIPLNLYQAYALDEGLYQAELFSLGMVANFDPNNYGGNKDLVRNVNEFIAGIFSGTVDIGERKQSIAKLLNHIDIDGKGISLLQRFWNHLADFLGFSTNKTLRSELDSYVKRGILDYANNLVATNQSNAMAYFMDSGLTIHSTGRRVLNSLIPEDRKEIREILFDKSEYDFDNSGEREFQFRHIISDRVDNDELSEVYAERYQEILEEDKNLGLGSTKSMARMLSYFYGMEIRNGQNPIEFLKQFTYKDYEQIYNFLWNSGWAGDYSTAKTPNRLAWEKEVKEKYGNRLDELEKKRNEYIKLLKKEAELNNYKGGVQAFTEQKLRKLYRSVQNQSKKTVINIIYNRGNLEIQEHNNDYFYGHEGHIESAWRESASIEQLLPRIAELLDLNPEDLEIVYVNGFQSYKRDDTLTKATEYHKFKPNYGQKLPISTLIDRLWKLNLGYKLLSINVFADKSTLPLLKIKKEIPQSAIKKLEILQDYYVKNWNLINSSNKVQPLETNDRALFLANTLRAFIEDVKMGDKSYEDIIKGKTSLFYKSNPNLESFDKARDFANLMKRANLANKMYKILYEDKDYLKAIKFKTTHTLQSLKFLGTVINKADGTKTDSYDQPIFWATDPQTGKARLFMRIAFVDGKSLGVSPSGKSYLDGQSIMLDTKYGFDSVMSVIAGYYNNGPIKNHYYGNFYELDGATNKNNIYLKHSVNSVPVTKNPDDLGTIMDAANIAMVIPIENEKYDNYPRDAVFTMDGLKKLSMNENTSSDGRVLVIPLDNWNDDTEKGQVHTETKGMMQFWFTKGLSLNNPFVANDETSKKILDHKDMVMTNMANRTVKNIKKYINNPAIIIDMIREYGVRAMYNQHKTIYDLLQTFIEQANYTDAYESIKGILQLPYFAKGINDKFKEQILKATKTVNKGSTLVLTSDLGKHRSATRKAVRNNIEDSLFHNDRNFFFSLFSHEELYKPLSNGDTVIENYIIRYAKTEELNNLQSTLDRTKLGTENYLSTKEKEEIREKISKLRKEILELSNILFDESLDFRKTEKYQKYEEEKLEEVFDENGFLRDDWTLVDEEFMKINNLKFGESVLATIVPMTNLAQTISLKVAGTTSVIGKNLTQKGSIIVNNEFIQAMGRDFDIDVLYVSTYDEEIYESREKWDEINEAVNKIVENYANMQYDMMNKVFDEARKRGNRDINNRAIPVNLPDRLPKITTTNKFKAMGQKIAITRDPKYAAPYAQILLGYAGEYDKTPFIGKGVEAIGEKFEKPVGFITSLQAKWTMLNAIGFKVGQYTDNTDKNTFVGYRVHSEENFIKYGTLMDIMSNHRLDIPNDISMFTYINDNKALKAMIYEKVDKNGNITVGSPLNDLQVMDEFVDILFGDSIKIYRGENRQGYNATLHEMLNLIKYQAEILENLELLNDTDEMVRNEATNKLVEMLYSNPAVQNEMPKDSAGKSQFFYKFKELLIGDNNVKSNERGFLNKIFIDKIYDYPLFQLIKFLQNSKINEMKFGVDRYTYYNILTNFAENFVRSSRYTELIQQPKVIEMLEVEMDQLVKQIENTKKRLGYLKIYEKIREEIAPLEDNPKKQAEERSGLEVNVFAKDRFELSRYREYIHENLLKPLKDNEILSKKVKELEAKLNKEIETAEKKLLFYEKNSPTSATKFSLSVQREIDAKNSEIANLEKKIKRERDFPTKFSDATVETLENEIESLEKEIIELVKQDISSDAGQKKVREAKKNKEKQYYDYGSPEDMREGKYFKRGKPKNIHIKNFDSLDLNPLSKLIESLALYNLSEYNPREPWKNNYLEKGSTFRLIKELVHILKILPDTVFYKVFYLYNEKITKESEIPLVKYILGQLNTDTKNRVYLSEMDRFDRMADNRLSKFKYPIHEVKDTENVESGINSTVYPLLLEKIFRKGMMRPYSVTKETIQRTEDTEAEQETPIVMERKVNATNEMFEYYSENGQLYQVEFTYNPAKNTIDVILKVITNAGQPLMHEVNGKKEVWMYTANIKDAVDIYDLEIPGNENKLNLSKLLINDLWNDDAQPAWNSIEETSRLELQKNLEENKREWELAHTATLLNGRPDIISKIRAVEEYRRNQDYMDAESEQINATLRDNVTTTGQIPETHFRHNYQFSDFNRLKLSYFLDMSDKDMLPITERINIVVDYLFRELQKGTYSEEQVAQALGWLNNPGLDWENRDLTIAKKTNNFKEQYKTELKQTYQYQNWVGEIEKKKEEIGRVIEREIENFFKNKNKPNTTGKTLYEHQNELTNLLSSKSIAIDKLEQDFLENREDTTYYEHNGIIMQIMKKVVPDAMKNSLEELNENIVRNNIDTNNLPFMIDSQESTTIPELGLKRLYKESQAIFQKLDNGKGMKQFQEFKKILDRDINAAYEWLSQYGTDVGIKTYMYQLGKIIDQDSLLVIQKASKTELNKILGISNEAELTIKDFEKLLLHAHNLIAQSISMDSYKDTPIKKFLNRWLIDSIAFNLGAKWITPTSNNLRRKLKLFADNYAELTDEEKYIQGAEVIKMVTQIFPSRAHLYGSTSTAGLESFAVEQISSEIKSLERMLATHFSVPVADAINNIMSILSTSKVYNAGIYFGEAVPSLLGDNAVTKAQISKLIMDYAKVLFANPVKIAELKKYHQDEMGIDIETSSKAGLASNIQYTFSKGKIIYTIQLKGQMLATTDMEEVLDAWMSENTLSNYFKSEKGIEINDIDKQIFRALLKASLSIRVTFDTVYTKSIENVINYLESNIREAQNLVKIKGMDLEYNRYIKILQKHLGKYRNIYSDMKRHTNEYYYQWLDKEEKFKGTNYLKPPELYSFIPDLYEDTVMEESFLLNYGADIKNLMVFLINPNNVTKELPEIIKNAINSSTGKGSNKTTNEKTAFLIQVLSKLSKYRASMPALGPLFDQVKKEGRISEDVLKKLRNVLLEEYKFYKKDKTYGNLVGNSSYKGLRSPKEYDESSIKRNIEMVNVFFDGFGKALTEDLTQVSFAMFSITANAINEKPFVKDKIKKWYASQMKSKISSTTLVDIKDLKKNDTFEGYIDISRTKEEMRKYPKAGNNKQKVVWGYVDKIKGNIITIRNTKARGNDTVYTELNSEKVFNYRDDGTKANGSVRIYKVPGSIEKIRYAMQLQGLDENHPWVYNGINFFLSTPKNLARFASYMFLGGLMSMRAGLKNLVGGYAANLSGMPKIYAQYMREGINLHKAVYKSNDVQSEVIKKALTELSLSPNSSFALANMILEGDLDASIATASLTNDIIKNIRILLKYWDVRNKTGIRALKDIDDKINTLLDNNIFNTEVNKGEVKSYVGKPSLSGRSEEEQAIILDSYKEIPGFVDVVNEKKRLVNKKVSAINDAYVKVSALTEEFEQTEKELTDKPGSKKKAKKEFNKKATEMKKKLKEWDGIIEETTMENYFKMSPQEARKELFNMLINAFNESWFYWFKKPEAHLRKMAFFIGYGEALDLYPGNYELAAWYGKQRSDYLHVRYGPKDRIIGSTTELGMAMTRFAQYSVKHWANFIKIFNQAKVQKEIYGLKEILKFWNTHLENIEIANTQSMSNILAAEESTPEDIAIIREVNEKRVRRGYAEVNLTRYLSMLLLQNAIMGSVFKIVGAHAFGNMVNPVSQAIGNVIVLLLQAMGADDDDDKDIFFYTQFFPFLGYFSTFWIPAVFPELDSRNRIPRVTGNRTIDRIVPRQLSIMKDILTEHEIPALKDLFGLGYGEIPWKK